MAIVNKMMQYFGLTEEYEVEHTRHQPEKEVLKNSLHTDNAPLEFPKKIKPNNQAHIRLVEPRSYNEAQNIADYLSENQSIIINIRSLDPKTVVRFLDFLSGVAYTLEGDIQRIDNDSFLCVPKFTNVQGTIHDEFM